MMRKVLGVVVGYGVWSVLWVGAGAVLQSSMPGSFGEDGSVSSTGLLICLLAIATVLSLVAGWLASAVGRSGRAAAAWTAGLLFATGLGVEIASWSLLPVWYHLVFLALLVPFTLVGGSLRARAA